jgi:hypothetical protein
MRDYRILFYLSTLRFFKNKIRVYTKQNSDFRNLLESVRKKGKCNQKLSINFINTKRYRYLFAWLILNSFYHLFSSLSTFTAISSITDQLQND